jgi:hypothetical protein
VIENERAVVSPRVAARIAGWGYLGIFVLALFANFFVRTRLIDPEDAAATANNILESEALFRSGVAAFTIVFALDLLIAWALYIFFRTVSRDVSLLAAWFRLGYTVLLGVAVVAFFTVLELVNDSGYAEAFGEQGRDAQVQLFGTAFNAAWLVGLALFGVHLVLLGFLAVRAGFVPRALGILLAVAGVAYVLDTFANVILSNYEDLEDVFLVIVAAPSIVGELWLTLWLLLRGGAAPDSPGGERASVAAPREAVSS